MPENVLVGRNLMGSHKQNNGICGVCGKQIKPELNVKKSGKSYFYTRSLCGDCRNKQYRMRKRIQKGEIRKIKASYTCIRCGWIGYCDTHHIDGNHVNNLLKNLERLCPNCHRTHHSPLNMKILECLMVSPNEGLGGK